MCEWRGGEGGMTGVRMGGVEKGHDRCGSGGVEKGA